MTADLAEFLRARLKAHEEAIRADAAHQVEVEPSLKMGTTWEFKSPGFRLAEVDAKERTIDLHGCETYKAADGGSYRYCTECGSGEPYEYPTPWPCRTLRLLTLPYADHRDYQPEWRP